MDKSQLALISSAAVTNGGSAAPRSSSHSILSAAKRCGASPRLEIPTVTGRVFQTSWNSNLSKFCRFLQVCLCSAQLLQMERLSGADTSHYAGLMGPACQSACCKDCCSYGDRGGDGPDNSKLPTFLMQQLMYLLSGAPVDCTALHWTHQRELTAQPRQQTLNIMVHHDDW